MALVSSRTLPMESAKNCKRVSTDCKAVRSSPQDATIHFSRQTGCNSKKAIQPSSMSEKTENSSSCTPNVICANKFSAAKMAANAIPGILARYPANNPVMGKNNSGRPTVLLQSITPQVVSAPQTTPPVCLYFLAASNVTAMPAILPGFMVGKSKEPSVAMARM